MQEYGSDGRLLLAANSQYSSSEFMSVSAAINHNTSDCIQSKESIVGSIIKRSGLVIYEPQSPRVFHENIVFCCQ